MSNHLLKALPARLKRERVSGRKGKVRKEGKGCVADCLKADFARLHLVTFILDDLIMRDQARQMNYV